MEYLTVATDGSLSVRHSHPNDAELLAGWWNDGSIMAHAGFPNGLGTNEAEVKCKILAESEKGRRFILESHGTPIGEANYRMVEPEIAQIGIKICVANQRERGLGTRYLKLIIAHVFHEIGAQKVILDTKPHNTRAQHVYENKIGFRRTRTTDEVIEYEITKAEFEDGPTSTHPT